MVTIRDLLANLHQLGYTTRGKGAQEHQREVKGVRAHPTIAVVRAPLRLDKFGHQEPSRLGQLNGEEEPQPRFGIGASYWRSHSQAFQV